jgi:hypothetical protein
MRCGRVMEEVTNVGTVLAGLKQGTAWKAKDCLEGIVLYGRVILKKN